MTQMKSINGIVFEEESLRDGLQIEKRIFTFDEKIKIFNLLVEAGVKRIQIGSFVHKERVPQMANTDELIQKITPPPDVLITGLILNERGLDRAIQAELKHVSMGASASDTHSRKNVNRSAEEALQDILFLISKAKKAGLLVRAGVQCAFGCVYEGKVPEERVLKAAKAIFEAGADEVNLADTTGMGNPVQIREVIRRLRQSIPQAPLSLHLHDTRGMGLANMLAGFEEGVKIFDACTGGLGGCPFVQGAAGNVPLEDAINMFESIGISTGIDLQKICAVTETLESLLDRKLPGRMSRVLKAQKPPGIG
jgi:hydroxymethylglutaryl-CoA lyase